MSETPHANQHPEQPREEQHAESPAEQPDTARTPEPEGGAAGTEGETGAQPSTAGEQLTSATRSAGRRVTRRTVDRREVTEYTQETITEDIPLAAYQGPGSAHPAPVG